MSIYRRHVNETFGLSWIDSIDLHNTPTFGSTFMKIVRSSLRWSPAQRKHSMIRKAPHHSRLSSLQP